MRMRAIHARCERGAHDSRDEHRTHKKYPRMHLVSRRRHRSRQTRVRLDPIDHSPRVSSLERGYDRDAIDRPSGTRRRARDEATPSDARRRSPVMAEEENCAVADMAGAKRRRVRTTTTTTTTRTTRTRTRRRRGAAGGSTDARTNVSTTSACGGVRSRRSMSIRLSSDTRYVAHEGMNTYKERERERERERDPSPPRGATERSKCGTTRRRARARDDDERGMTRRGPSVDDELGELGARSERGDAKNAKRDDAFPRHRVTVRFIADEDDERPRARERR